MRQTQALARGMNRARRRQAAKKARDKGGRNGQGRAAIAAPGVGRTATLAEELCQRGIGALQEGRSQEATRFLSQAIAIEERNPVYHYIMGKAVAIDGRLVEAEAHLRVALLLKPDFAAAHGFLGKVLWERGRIENAEASMARAVCLAPDDPEALYDLACAFFQQGKLQQAIDAYLRAIDLNPDVHKYRQALGQCILNVNASPYSPSLHRAVEAVFFGLGANKQRLTPAAIEVLKHNAGCRALVKAVRQNDEAALESEFRQGAFDTLFDNRLFLCLLEEVFLTVPEIEIGLTAIRRFLLTDALDGRTEVQPSRGFHFLCALARQCFNNEFIYAVTGDEIAALDLLQSGIETRLASSGLDSRLQAALAVFSLYKPLKALSGADDLPESGDPLWPPPMKPLIKQHLDDWRTERRLAARMEPVTPIDDDVSRAVKAQYEENPYPRWMSIDSEDPRPTHFVLRSLFPHFAAPAVTGRGPRILVAGCGTGRHAILAATRFRDAQVLAIDLSAASLAYGARKARELDVSNITFKQGDILALGALDARFDIVECGGVLHHMRDPAQGWRVLADLLAPSGMMKVALYSARAREKVDAVRDRLVADGFVAKLDSIRAFRREILSLPKDDTRSEARGWQDFYSTSECRDLLFHVQEHCFTLPQIGGELDRLGLSFVGFEFADQAARKKSYLAAFPNDPNMTDLACWDEYEKRNPDLFAGMYQFWCQKT